MNPCYGGAKGFRIIVRFHIMVGRPTMPPSKIYTFPNADSYRLDLCEDVKTAPEFGGHQRATIHLIHSSPTNITAKSRRQDRRIIAVCCPSYHHAPLKLPTLKVPHLSPHLECPNPHSTNSKETGFAFSQIACQPTACWAIEDSRLSLSKSERWIW